MSFIGQAAKIFDGMAEFRFQAVLFGRNAIYLEGAKPVRIDECEMIFRTPTCTITLAGSGLSVIELSDDCVSVVGRIDGFWVKDL